MILDIIAAVIILLAAARHASRGFLVSVISLAEWFLSLACGFLFSSDLAGYLAKSTGMDEQISGFITGTFPTELQAIASNYKSIFGSMAESSATPEDVAARITMGVLTIIAFILIVLAVVIIAAILKAILKPDHDHGIIGRADMIGGFAVGLAFGLLDVLILLAVLRPVMGLLPNVAAEWVKDQLNTSYVTGALYAANPIIYMLKEMF
ncbi:MAG: CvpA family protein [Eubacteriales bacterium]|nr:CvpA family protein [Eubacteriales bacterium]